MNISLLMSPQEDDALHTFANFVLLPHDKHDSVSCGMHWRKQKLMKALDEKELPSPLSVDGNYGDDHLRRVKTDVSCQTDVFDHNSEVERLLKERDHLLKQIELLSLGQKVEKRNSNACREHKEKHLKCPLTCPNRKANKALLKRKRSMPKEEETESPSFSERRSLRPRKNKSSASESDLDELYQTAQEELAE